MVSDCSPGTEGSGAGLALLFSLHPGTVVLGVATAKLDTVVNATCLKNEWPGLGGRGQGAGSMGAMVYDQSSYECFLSTYYGLTTFQAPSCDLDRQVPCCPGAYIRGWGR